MVRQLNTGTTWPSILPLLV